MRAVIQVVSQASVTVEEKVVGAIAQGLLILLGIGQNDSEQDADYLVDKVTHLRIFPDKNGMMNLSVRDVAGEILVISQFTLYADCHKGRRPSYQQAAPPELAKQLYHHFVNRVKGLGIPTACGQFQAMMAVSLINQGPVTIHLDSQRR